MDELIQEKVTQKENELNATYDERIRNYEERLVSFPSETAPSVNMYLLCREQDLQRQVALTKGQLRDLRMSNETNQAKLLDHTQRQGTLYGPLTSEFFVLVSVSCGISYLRTNRSRSGCKTRRARYDGSRSGACQ